MAFKAKIIGIPHIPMIVEVNIRAEANKGATLLFKIPVGTAGLDVIDVKADTANDAQGGKVFQWFKLAFSDGQQGWCRDDLLEALGDGTPFGYGQVAASTVGFNLTRTQAPAAAPAPIPFVVPSAPVAPAPVPSAPVPSAPVPSAPVVVVQTNANTGPGMIVCMGQTGANVRPGPGTTTGAPISRIAYMAEASIIGIAASKDPSDPFQWINIDYQGQKGWLREDFTRLKGNFEQYGLAFHDMYPSPAPESWWARDFNRDPNFNPVMHDGWDHSGKIGSPIIGGPNGGKVIKVAFCQKCGANGVSAVDRGYTVSDGRVLSDPAWNYGYGHFVNVTYHHDKLPKSTQDRLAAQGKAGWHISVNHGHLQTIAVQADQEFGANTQIGTLGNSGNSTGPHLHLEVRAHQNPNLTDWASMKSGLMSPSILFLR